MPPYQQCDQKAGEVLATNFHILRSGNSGEFPVADAPADFRIVKLKYQLVVGSNDQQISGQLLIKRISDKLQHKLKNAIFVWNQVSQKPNPSPQSQIYPLPFDPNIVKVASLIAEWIQVWLKKWRVSSGVKVSQVKLKDSNQVFGLFECQQ